MPEEVMQSVEIYQTLSDTATKLGIPKGKIRFEVDSDDGEAWFGVILPYLDGFSQLFEALGGPKKSRIGWFGYESGPNHPIPFGLAVWVYPGEDVKKASDFLKSKTGQAWEGDEDGLYYRASPAGAQTPGDWFLKPIRSLKD